MSTPLDKITEVEDRIIENLAKAKDPVVTGVSKVVGFVDGRVDDLPTLPRADRLPTPGELVDNYFAFRGKLLDLNKDIAKSVVDAVAPLTNQMLNRRPKVSTAKSEKAA